MEYMNFAKGKDSDEVNLLLQLCYTYSAFIVAKYQKMLTSYLGNYDAELPDYAQDIYELKRYVLMEHKLYLTLLQTDIQTTNQAIHDVIQNPNYTPPYLRLRNKLQFSKNISYECSFSAQDLGLYNIPNHLKFDLLLAVQTYAHLETIKNVKYALPNLVEEDSPFFTILNKYLNAQLLYKSCANDLFEIIAIYSDMDIDSLPSIDFNKIRETYDEVYSKSIISPNNMLSDTLFSLILEELNRIKHLNNIDQDESRQLKTLFDYVYSITRIKILISKMDIKTLEKTKTYCSKLSFENKTIQNEIKKILKNPDNYI